MSSLVPDGWSEEYISEYFDFSIGGTPSRNNELYWDANQTTSNIWVSIKDLKDKFISNSAERISDLGVSKSNVKLLPKNTVLMSFKLSIGRLAISTTPLYTNEAIVGFIEKRPNIVDRDYLYYGLQSWNLLGEVDQAVKGATLNKDKMSRILGVFPPLLEQKKIASILTSVDEVIENTQKQIDKLQDLKKATMNELLTKGIGHTEFKDSELGRIPKSWEVKRLDEIDFKIVVGYVGNVNNFYCDKSVGIPFFRTQNIRPDRFINHTNVSVTRDFHAKNNKSRIENGDVLIARVGANLGMVCEVKGILGEANAANVIIIKRREDFSSEFLSLFLNSEKGKGSILVDAMGGAQGVFNTTIAKSLLVPVTTKKEMSEITRVIASIQRDIEEQQHKLHKTQSLKKSLMQDLLTGKVRVVVN